MKNSFIRQGIEKSKCVVVYNGIDSNTIPQVSRKEIRTAWGISDSEIVIGTVGSLIKRKQIKDLVESIAVMAGISEQPMKCMIVGKGSEKGNLVEMVKRKNLGGSVIFTGFQSDAISYINALDIFVLTSKSEGLPRVILEAMLMGKPVIASDITGPSELVVEGDTGFLVPVGKTEAIAGAIIRLTENAALREQMGEKAKERVIRNFPVEKYVNDVENIFAEVLGH